MALQVGDLLSQRYRIGQILTQSGGEALYKAHDQVSGNDVLVKEFASPGNPGDISDTTQVEILVGLRHPNLVSASDRLTIAGQGAYVVLDTGGNEVLRQRLENTGPMPYTEVVPLILNLCDAVFYLHDHQPPLVHGAIGLESIFVTPDGKVTLLYVGDQAKPTAEPSRISDVIDLGKTAYTLLTNLPPPEASDGIIQTQIETRLQADFPQIPASIGAVIARCVDPTPEKGFGSIEDFKAALLYALVQIPPETLRMTPLTFSQAVPTSSEGFNPVIPSEPENQPSQATCSSRTDHTNPAACSLGFTLSYYSTSGDPVLTA